MCGVPAASPLEKDLDGLQIYNAIYLVASNIILGIIALKSDWPPSLTVRLVIGGLNCSIAIFKVLRRVKVTDGIVNIPSYLFRSREETIRKFFETSCPEEIPDRLLETNETLSGGWDDIAIIVLDPCSLPILSGCFLFGGTSQTEERVF